jgi:hypothetical protein
MEHITAFSEMKRPANSASGPSLHCNPSPDKNPEPVNVTLVPPFSATNFGVIFETMGMAVYWNCTRSFEKSTPFDDGSMYDVPTGMEGETHRAMVLLSNRPLLDAIPPKRQ